MREIYTIKRITSCRPELLTLPYSHTHTHKGCQRSPTKLVYRRLHRSGREQVKRLLFGRRGGGGGGETSFFFHLRRNEWSSYWTLHRCSPRARVCPSYLVFLLIISFIIAIIFFLSETAPRVTVITYGVARTLPWKRQPVFGSLSPPHHSGRSVASSPERRCDRSGTSVSTQLIDKKIVPPRLFISSEHVFR